MPELKELNIVILLKYLFVWNVWVQYKNCISKLLNVLQIVGRFLTRWQHLPLFDTLQKPHTVVVVVVLVVLFLSFPGHSFLLRDATFSTLCSQVGWGTNLAEVHWKYSSFCHFFFPSWITLGQYSTESFVSQRRWSLGTHSWWQRGCVRQYSWQDTLFRCHPFFYGTSGSSSCSHHAVQWFEEGERFWRLGEGNALSSSFASFIQWRVQY